MNSLLIDATTENLDPVLDFINAKLEEINCPMADAIQIGIAVEELYINIAHYAYNPAVGSAQVICEVEENPPTVTITLLDQGKPYNPLARQDPNVTLSTEERDIGGLGIYMVKQSMDNVEYKYKDGKNIIRLHKRIAE